MRTIIIILLLCCLAVAGGAANWRIFHSERMDLVDHEKYENIDGWANARGCRSRRLAAEVPWIFPAAREPAGTNSPSVVTNPPVGPGTTNAAAPAATNAPPPATTNPAPPAATNATAVAEPPPDPPEPGHGDLDFETRAIQEGIPMAPFEEVQARIGDVLLIDARDAFEFGQGHIPGAHSVPFEFSERKGAEAKLRALTEELSKPTIVYCGDKFCPKAYDLTKYLRSLGHGDVLLYAGGFGEWEQRGGEVAK